VYAKSLRYFRVLQLRFAVAPIKLPQVLQAKFKVLRSTSFANELTEAYHTVVERNSSNQAESTLSYLWLPRVTVSWGYKLQAAEPLACMHSDWTTTRSNCARC
jgi:hypothetical protein